MRIFNKFYLATFRRYNDEMEISREELLNIAKNMPQDRLVSMNGKTIDSAIMNALGKHDDPADTYICTIKENSSSDWKIYLVDYFGECRGTLADLPLTKEEIKKNNLKKKMNKAFGKNN